MPDYSEFLNTIKQAATEAVDASRPTQICFGKVTSTSPLKILVDQKLLLDSTFLVLTRNVTDYKTKIAESESSAVSVTIHNSLIVGEEVILLRMQGGQKYIVVDRIGGD